MTAAIDLQDVIVEGESGVRELDLSLSVAVGELVVLLGPNRCGKSLVLELCAGLLAPQRGTVRALGLDLAELSEDALRDLRLRMGVVLQQPGLLSNMTIFNNVALPLRYHGDLSEPEIEQRVSAVLSELDLISLRDRFPAQLNPGEARRGAIARALIMDPELLLLDEPTAGVDAERSRQLAELLDRCRRARPLTIVAALNGFSALVDCADRVAFMRAGRIEAIGPRAELMTTDAGRRGYLR